MTATVILHREWAPSRKTDPIHIDGPAWRSRVAAVPPPGAPTMPTRTYAQAVVCRTVVDIEAGRVAASRYNAAIVQVTPSGALESITHPGHRANVGFAWIVGAAVGHVDTSLFADGHLDVGGGPKSTRDTTAAAIAQLVIDHPKVNSRRGRPW